MNFINFVVQKSTEMSSSLKRILLSLFVVILLCPALSAERLVILRTNDTHSQIEPTDKGFGGIMRRKALVDSVRKANKNVMLVDAGDMVQGTIYFTLYGGEVEAKLMNALGYDIQILGNHEFDNGVGGLYKFFNKLNADKISTNYDFGTTPLAGIFKPYVIREFDGKKIGFIAINLDPSGMIAAKNSKGITYLDGIKAANSTAWHLKHNEKCDLVIALTHIGYKEDGLICDEQLAKESEDIDIIIGGHSHTKIDPSNPDSPAWIINNAVGKPVLVTQCGKSGVDIGEIDIDLDTFEKDYKLLPVDSRYDKSADSTLTAILEPYRAGVDAYYKSKIGKTEGLKKDDWSLVNWMADFILGEGRRLTDRKVDLAITNKGGVRADMPAGNVTKGTILQIFPFDNRAVVIEMTGQQLQDALDIMARRGGDGVSANVDIKMAGNPAFCQKILIDGKPIDKNKIYNVATIDYLAGGGDYMAPMKGCKVIAESKNVLYTDMIDWISKQKKTLKADRTVRMHK